MPFGSEQWMYASGGFYPYEIDQSLRFNDDDSAYLSRTPASAGNRKTWTLSLWAKRSELDANNELFGVSDGTDFFRLFFFNDTIRIRSSVSGNTVNQNTVAVFRDPSAWYHIVLAVDTTQATDSNRVRLYINSQELSLSNTIGLNVEFLVNAIEEHTLGEYGGSFFDGYMAEVNFIDGQALDPTSFGEFKSGVWIPKSYSGTYGTNGFYLPFNDAGFLGKDASTVLGSELITNGTFDSDITGWSDHHGESNITWDAGRLKVYRNTRTFPKAVQDIATTIGSDYIATLTYVGGTHDGDINLEAISSGSSIGDLTVTPTTGSQYQLSFTATATTTTIRIGADSLTNVGEYSLFDDVSVKEITTQGNNWTPNNLAATDQVPDSPTNNFCTLNPLIPDADLTPFLAEGNLRLKKATSGGESGSISGTIAVSSGKYYFEGELSEYSGSSILRIGFNNENNPTGSGLGYKQVSGNGLYMIAIDLDSEVYWTGTNGTWDVGDPDAGTGGTSYSSSYRSMIPFVRDNSGSTNNGGTWTVNFGQDSSFAGNKTAQGNTDANGIGDFYYAPPAGYLALCTANLPDPAIDPANDDVPADYFNTVLYTATGNDNLAITGVGFQPDFTWIKSRSSAYSHNVYDAVRGVSKRLQTNLTNAESSPISGVKSFDADGFTLGNDTNDTNFTSGVTYASWNWLAGNGTSSNTDGTITSTVSANQKAGFSIVSYTGNGSNNQSVGHGLGKKPSFVIIKNRDAATNWVVLTDLIDGSNDGFYLNTTDAKFNASTNVATDSVFYTVYSASNNMIAYCFAEVEGFSKFGSYTGNGSADGPFVYTGFRPAFVMIKRTDADGSWAVWDNKRNTYNVSNNYLVPNVSDAENTYGAIPIDTLSNGFKIRTNSFPMVNASSSPYIFMAFAEMPTKYSLGA